MPLTAHEARHPSIAEGLFRERAAKDFSLNGERKKKSYSSKLLDLRPVPRGSIMQWWLECHANRALHCPAIVLLHELGWAITTTRSGKKLR